jgi:hypothetical protein
LRNVIPARSRVGPPGIGWLVTAAFAVELADSEVELVAVGRADDEPAWLEALADADADDADAGEAGPDGTDFEWQAVAAIARAPIAATRRLLRCDRRATRSAPSVLSNICGQP